MLDTIHNKIRALKPETGKKPARPAEKTLIERYKNKKEYENFNIGNINHSFRQRVTHPALPDIPGSTALFPAKRYRL